MIMLRSTHNRIVETLDRLSAVKYRNTAAEEAQRLFYEVCETGEPFMYRGRLVRVVVEKYPAWELSETES
jgi:hypothetical protein